MKAAPFLIGAWIPYWFGWFGGIQFPIAATIVIGFLVATKTMRFL